MSDEQTFLGATEEPNGDEHDAGDELRDVLPEDDTVAESFAEDDAVDAEFVVDFGELQRERDEYLDTLRRLQADFDNFRKRTLRQQTETLDRASSSLIERLLPVLDALDLALAHSNDDDETKGSHEALVQIATLTWAILEKEGLERIDEIGAQFDPTIHDAVSHIESDGLEEAGPVVADVMRSGYRLKGKVLRPAMVTVKG